MAVLKYFFISILLITIPVTANCAVPTWQIVKDKSTLNFIAIQNGAPVKGDFKSFTGNINFAPDQLADSKVVIEVDINSITLTDKDIESTLKSPEWFDIKLFPKAIFSADKFIKIGNAYQAGGELTINGKKIATKLSFNLDEYSDKLARASGSLVIKRTVFTIGKGEWADTSSIKDDVKVEFKIEANRTN